jgi:predicted transcriptional regulator
MRTNYMMTVDDVMEELGVKRSKAYSILKQLNDELAKEGTERADAEKNR